MVMILVDDWECSDGIKCRMGSGWGCGGSYCALIGMVAVEMDRCGCVTSCWLSR